MKSRIITALFLFMTLSTSLFAFSNKYFSVKDSGWEVKRISDKDIGFMMKDYVPEEGDETGLPPIVNVNIEGEKEDTIYRANYDKTELNRFENLIKDKAFKQYLEEGKKASREYLENNFKGASKRKIDDAIEDIYKDSKIESASISKIGNSKSFQVDFQIGSIHFRRFVVTTLHRVTIVEFKYPVVSNFTSSKTYKDFISSFKINDKEGSAFNVFLYGGMGMNILKLIVIVLISIGVKIFRNRA